MSKVQNKRLKSIAIAVAIILGITALAFGVSKFVLSQKTQDKALNFSKYRVQVSEIGFSPKDATAGANDYTGGEVKVEITPSILADANNGKTDDKLMTIQYQLTETNSQTGVDETKWVDYTGPFYVDHNVTVNTRLVSVTDENFKGPVTSKDVTQIAVAKIGTTTYKTLAEAITAWNEMSSVEQQGKKIEMVANTTENVTIPQGKNVIIDLCGFNINEKTAQTPVITVNGTLNLIDSGKSGQGTTYGSVTSTDSNAVVVSGTGTLSLGTNESATSGNEEVVNANGPVINGGTGSNGVVIAENGKLDFYDGKITAPSAANHTAIVVNNTPVGESDSDKLTTPNGYRLNIEVDEVSGREVATLVKTMTVHFDSNGGTPSDIADIEAAEGKAYGTYGAWPSDPSREGYVFAGWKDSEDVVTSSTIVTRTADHTLTAIWTPNTYSIVYNANTGIGTIANTTATYDTDITLPNTEAGITKTGYTLKGWSIDSNATTPTYTPGQILTNLTTINNDTITLYAIWKDETAPNNEAPTGTSTTSSITVNCNQTDSGSGIDNNSIQYSIYKDGAWTEWQNTATFDDLTSNTDYQVKTRVKDKDGNGYTESQAATIKTQGIQNATTTIHKDTATGEEITNATGYINNETVVLTVIPSTTAGTTKITVTSPNGTKTEYELGADVDLDQDGTYHITIPNTVTGTYTIKTETTDGTNTSSNTQTFKIDRTKPTISATVDTTTNSVTVTANIQDANSGVKTTTYELLESDGTTGANDANNQPVALNTTGKFTGLKDNHDYKVRITVTDNAGNTETKVVNAKTTELVIGTLTFKEVSETGNFTPNTSDPNEQGATISKIWKNDNVQVKIATTGNGTSTTYTYQKFGGSESSEKSATSTITTENGDYIVKVKTTDGANTKTQSYYFSIDKTAPTVEMSPNSGDLEMAQGASTGTIESTLTIAEDVNGSGLAQVRWAISNDNITAPTTGWTTETPANTINVSTSKGVGTYYIWAEITDNAGNVSTSAKTSGAFNVKYVVEFDKNIDKTAVEIIDTETIKTMESTVALADAPTREGYLFKGWALDENETNVANAYSAGASYTVASSTRFYAMWSEIVASTTVNGVTTYFDSVQGAVDYANNNTATVTLIKSTITENVSIVAGQNITLNTNGNTLTSTETTITNNGTLKINGNGIINSTIHTINNYGDLTIENVTVRSSKRGIQIYGDNTKTTTINNGAIIEAYNSAVYINSEAKVIVNGGSITGHSGVYNNLNGHIEINGGSITATGVVTTSPESAQGVRVAAGTAIINNGTITGKAYGTSVTTGELVIKGGTVVAEAGRGATVNGTTGKLTIGEEGGTPSISVPSVQGTTYGVELRNGNLYFYDGIAKGITEAVHQNANTNEIVTQEGYRLIDAGDQVIGGETYHTAHLDNHYTVTFDGNGATPSKANMTVEYGTAYGELATVSRTGYTFDGWKLNTTIITETTNVSTASDHTLIAQWTPNTYTLTFNANGGSVTSETKKVTYNSTYGELPTPERPGYTFTGWKDALNNTYSETDTVTITANTELIAQWTADNYTVTFNPNGGTVNPTTKSVTYDQAYGTLPTPTKEGYTFNGWKLNTTIITETTNVTTASAHTLIADWTPTPYTITYNYNGGSLATGSTETTTYTIEDTVILPTATKTGYNFIGWKEQGADDSTAVTQISGKTGNLNLVAVYTSGDVFYKIHHFVENANDNKYTEEPVEIVTKLKGVTPETNVKTGDVITLNSTQAKAIANTTVEKVTATPNGTNGGAVTVAADSSTEIYVYYKRDKFDLTVTAGSNTKNATGTGKYKWGQTVDISAQYANVTGYEYSNFAWTTTDTSILAGTSESSTTVTMPTANTTVTSTATRAAIQYSISYELNGGSVSTTNPTTYTVETNTITLNNPTKPGYTFAGWTGTGLSTVTKTVKIAKGSTGNRTYTATWTANNYSISYNLDGGSVTGTNPTSYTIESNNITLINPTKAGYTFAGWTGTGLSQATSAVTIAKGSTGNRSYAATWTANTYTVTLDANNGTVTPTSIEVTYNNNYGTLPTPTRTGYTFDGWYYNENKVESTTKVTTASAHTLIAEWTVNTHTLTYDFGINGGQASSSNNSTSTTEQKDYGTKIDLTKSAYKANSAFLGWAETAEATTALSTSAILTMPDANKTLYAIYANMNVSENTETIDLSDAENPTHTKTITVTGSNYGTASVSSSDSATATATITGNTITITALKTGTATITVTSSATDINEDAITKTITVNVIKTPTALTITPATTTLKIDSGFNTTTLNATITPTQTTQYNTITWTSSNPEVATVDQQGNVTAVSLGTTTITASTGKNNVITATATIIVETSNYAEYQGNNIVNYYSTLKDAFDNAVNGNTVKPLNNTVNDASIYNPTLISGKTLTLDLSGKNVILSKNIINNGSLTISDSIATGILESDETVISCNSASSILNITSGTISGNQTVVIEGGTANVTGGTIIGESDGVIVETGATLTLGNNDSTVTSSKDAHPLIEGGVRGVQNSNGTFNFYDGAVKGPVNSSIDGTVTAKPTGYIVRKYHDMVNGTAQETAVLEPGTPSVIITGEATGVTTGLIRHYDGTNNLGNGHSNTPTRWVDLSGHQDAELNGVTFDVNGATFNGTSDYATLGEINNIEALTIQVDVKINKIESGEKFLVSNFERGGAGLELIDGKPTFAIYVPGKGYNYCGIDQEIDTAYAHNIAGTYDGTTMSLYIDGVLHNTTTVGGAIGNPTDNTVMAIGTNPKGNGVTSTETGFASMKMYSTRIYDRGITQLEIKQNMNATRIRNYIAPGNASNDANVTLSIIFNEEVTGFTADDITVTNATKGELTGSGANYTLAITDIISSKTLSIKINDKSYTNLAGVEGSSYEVGRYRDVSSPSPTITANPSDEPTNANIITYTIDYNESGVLGLTADEITVTNGTKGTFTQLGYGEYSLEVTTTESGNQTITVPAGACFNSCGNPSLAASKTVVVDKEAPIITPTMESVLNSSFDSWELEGGAYIDNDGTLILPSTGAKAWSPYMYVNGNQWSFTADALSTSISTRYVSENKAAWYMKTLYFDDNLDPTNAPENSRAVGAQGNGSAGKLDLNTWAEAKPWTTEIYASNIKYVRMCLSVDGEYSLATTKYKNPKFVSYTTQTDKKVTIQTAVTDNLSGIVHVRWLSGEKTVANFVTGGTEISGSLDATGNKFTGSFDVTSNGKYTIFAMDNAGNATVNVVEVNLINANSTTDKLKVTFDANGGEVSTSYKFVTYGKTYEELPTPTRTGYTFDGWYTEVSDGTQCTNETSVSRKVNHSLYAHWTANSYKLVKYNGINLIDNGTFEKYTTRSNQGWDGTLNGVEGDPAKAYNVTNWGTGYNSGVANPSAGYHAHMKLVDGNAVLQFKTNEDISGVATNRWLGISQTIDGAKFTAGKTYKITMDVYRVSGSTYVTAGIQHTSNSGSSYAFSSGSGRFIPTTTGQWETLSWTFTLSAEYTYSNGTTTYNPRLYLYGHNSGTAGDLYVDNVKVEEADITDKVYDTTYTSAELPTPTKTGYTFAGWYADANYTTPISTSNKFTESTATFENVNEAGTNAYIYGKWTPNTYTIKFNANYGSASGTMEDQVMTVGVAQNLTANAYRAAAGFIGWNTKADGTGTHYDDMQSVVNLTTTQDEVVDLYGEWGIIAEYDSTGKYVAKYWGIAPAFENAQSGNTLKTLITANLGEYPTNPEGKTLIFDLNGKSIGCPTLYNNGNLTIKDSGTGGVFNMYTYQENGTLTLESGIAAASIEVSGGTYIVNGGQLRGNRIEVKQNGKMIINDVNDTSSVFNVNGELDIYDGKLNSYLYVEDGGTTNMYGGTIHYSGGSETIYLYKGTLNIEGGTIISDSYRAIGVHEASGTIILGKKDNNINLSAPVIQGGQYGINFAVRSPKLFFYDGIVKGGEKAFGNQQGGDITLEDNSSLVYGTEVIDYLSYGGRTYGTAAVQKNATLTVNPNGGTWNGKTTSQTYNQGYGSELNIPVPTRAGYTFTGWTLTGANNVSLANGRLGESLHTDSTFESGTNDIAAYNNINDGTVTVKRTESSYSAVYYGDNPIGDYVVEVQPSSTATPEMGGFKQVTNSAANQKYIHVFIATLPTGYRFCPHMNSVGNGSSVTWLTSREGTGAYAVYAYQVNAGSSGTFRTFGYVSVEESTQPANSYRNNSTFWIAYSDVINITNTKGTKYIFGSSNATLKANWTQTSGQQNIVSQMNSKAGVLRTLSLNNIGLNLQQNADSNDNISDNNAFENISTQEVEPEKEIVEEPKEDLTENVEKDIETETNPTDQNIIALVQINETTYPSLSEAIASANNGDTIKLLENIEQTDDVTIEQGKNIIIDLNGKTLTSSSSNTIANQGTLTIKGTGIIKNETENGNVIYNTGILNIENGIITTAKNGGKGVYNASVNQSGTTATLNMKSGKIVTEGIGSIGIYNIEKAKTLVSGGIIETRNYASKSIYNDSEIEINNAKVIVADYDSIGIYNASNSKACRINKTEIKVEAEEIENYELIKNTNEFKETLNNLKPSYGIYNDSNVEVIIEDATMKIERLKGVGIFNKKDGTVTLGKEDDNVNSATPIIYAISDNTTGIINNEKGKINFYDGRIITTSSIKNMITKVLFNYEIYEELNSNIINTTLRLIEIVNEEKVESESENKKETVEVKKEEEVIVENKQEIKEEVKGQNQEEIQDKGQETTQEEQPQVKKETSEAAEGNS